MKKSLLKQLLIVFLSSIVLGCASTPEGQSAGEKSASAGSDCISEGTIRSYKVLNDSNLVVTARIDRNYHMRLGRPATGLRSAWSIGFTSPTSRICPGFSELLVDDTFGPERVRILSIQHLTEEEYEDLLYRFGKGGTGEKAPPEPEPVEGAEVEELD